MSAIADLVNKLAEYNWGCYFEPIREGQTLGGMGSTTIAQFDGWLVGQMAGHGGYELAVGRTPEEAAAAGLIALDAEED